MVGACGGAARPPLFLSTHAALSYLAKVGPQREAPGERRGGARETRRADVGRRRAIGAGRLPVLPLLSSHLPADPVRPNPLAIGRRKA